MDNKDKQALIDGTATIPYKLHILNDDGSIKDTLTEEDIVSTDYEDYRYVDSSSLCIGQFVARKLKGEIKTIDKDLQIFITVTDLNKLPSYIKDKDNKIFNCGFGEIREDI